jgi:transposase
MSEKELTRLDIMKRLEGKSMHQAEAAQQLGISVRQVKRIWRAYREGGAEELISRRRGMPSNNRLSQEVKQQALDLLDSRYPDFGPTLAHEKLSEVHQLKLSVETVRKLMMVTGLWKSKRAKKLVVHQMRARRACLGELVQIDGSPHKWFEERGPSCTLLVFIDDATGRLMELYFASAETMFSYSEAVRRYLTQYGKPMALYSDKNGIFKVNIKNALSGTGMTQFGRAMKELDIKILCANTPQAKGRVERAIQTLQDRLVKEMRLKGIASIETANQYAPEFIAEFNARFAVAPQNSRDAHRPLLSSDNLDHILTWQEPRILSKNLTLQYKKVVYQIKTTRPTYAMRKAAVTVCENAQAEITILYKGHPLKYTVFQKQEHQAEVVTNKTVDQKVEQTHRPTKDHPWRKYGHHLNGKPIQGVNPRGTD